jgi:hypothetical protein
MAFALKDCTMSSVQLSFLDAMSGKSSSREHNPKHIDGTQVHLRIIVTDKLVSKQVVTFLTSLFFSFTA